MKSTFLKAAKALALSLVLSLGATGVVFANGGGAPTAKKVAFNGGGGSTARKSKRGKRVAKRVRKNKNKQTA